MKYLLPHLVEDAACRHPDAAAVVHGDESITYSDLFERSARLTRLLAELGVRKGDRVGVFFEKSIEMVVGLYGTMQAGAAYVPLDSSNPASRLAYITAHCGISVLLTTSEMVESCVSMLEADAPLRHVVVLDGPPTTPLVESVDVVDASSLSELDPRPAVGSTIDRDPAYILYTSGSTGYPKGVTLSHRNGLAFAAWAAEEFRLTSADRVSQIAPLTFDLSTFDLFATAFAGASVHLVDRQVTVFPLQLRRLLERSEISVTYAVPSVLTMLLERGKLETGDLPALRTVLFAGEVFPSRYLGRLMRLLPHASFANLYGPTETNVCTFHRVPTSPAPDDPPVSIGRPVANDEAIVVTDDGAVARPGDVGELLVRGATVMQGYWNDPERTARSLVANPVTCDPADLVYRTGDLVREEADGTFTFLGRRDSQVKRMGYRIELGEIEAAFLRIDQVVECAVTARPDESTGTRLTAHLVLRGGASGDDVVREASRMLPRYMVPDAVEQLGALPKTANGKVDRVRLSAHDDRDIRSAEGPVDGAEDGAVDGAEDGAEDGKDGA